MLHAEALHDVVGVVHGDVCPETGQAARDLPEPEPFAHGLGGLAAVVDRPGVAQDERPRRRLGEEAPVEAVDDGLGGAGHGGQLGFPALPDEVQSVRDRGDAARGGQRVEGGGLAGVPVGGESDDLCLHGVGKREKAVRPLEWERTALVSRVVLDP